MNFSNNNIQIATKGIAQEIMELLNKAYRGEESKKGWTTEASLIAGDIRTSIEMVDSAITAPLGNMLIYISNNKVIGCVHLQQNNNKLYLGMFAVEPTLQGGGIGKTLLQAAEIYCLQKQLNCIYMKVVSVRTELIDWYKRHGYIETGETIDFNEDKITGKHLQKLQFIVLEKKLV